MTHGVYTSAGMLPLEPIESRLARVVDTLAPAVEQLAPSVSWSGAGTRERRRGMRSFGQAVDRARRRALSRGGYTFAGADLVCVSVFGCHPAEVYGDDWWAAVAERGPGGR